MSKSPHLGIFFAALLAALFVEMWLIAALTHFTSLQLMYFHVWWGLPHFFTEAVVFVSIAIVFANFVARRFS